MSSGDHLEVDGQAERVNQILEDMLRGLCFRKSFRLVEVLFTP